MMGISFLNLLAHLDKKSQRTDELVIVSILRPNSFLFVQRTWISRNSFSFPYNYLCSGLSLMRENYFLIDQRVLFVPSSDLRLLFSILISFWKPTQSTYA